ADWLRCVFVFSGWGRGSPQCRLRNSRGNRVWRLSLGMFLHHVFGKAHVLYALAMPAVFVHRESDVRGSRTTRLAPLTLSFCSPPSPPSPAPIFLRCLFCLGCPPHPLVDGFRSPLTP
ncbi:unnamed protein product, partial [Ectocarpus sp. 12 AP-2014]